MKMVTIKKQEIVLFFGKIYVEFVGTNQVVYFQTVASPSMRPEEGEKRGPNIE